MRGYESANSCRGGKKKSHHKVNLVADVELSFVSLDLHQQMEIAQLL